MIHFIGWNSSYFKILKGLVGENGRLFWVLGSDVVHDMKKWKIKARELFEWIDSVVIYRRGHDTESILLVVEEILGLPRTQFKPNFVILKTLPEEATIVSSSQIREHISQLQDLADPRILRYIFENDFLLNFYKNMTS